MAAKNELEERLKALNFLPQTYITYLRGLHDKQGPYRKIAAALDNFITWCIKYDPAVGQSQRHEANARTLLAMRTTSTASPPSTTPNELRVENGDDCEQHDDQGDGVPCWGPNCLANGDARGASDQLLSCCAKPSDQGEVGHKEPQLPKLTQPVGGDALLRTRQQGRGG
jgi:hypothetical protein